MTIIKTYTVSSRDLQDEIIRLLKEDGLHPDEKKLREILGRAPMDSLARLYNMIYRFGAKEVLASVC